MKKPSQTKRIVNVRLRSDQIQQIEEICKGSPLLDTSKYVRVAVDWLLLHDIGKVMKELHQL